MVYNFTYDKNPKPCEQDDGVHIYYETVIYHIESNLSPKEVALKLIHNWENITDNQYTNMSINFNSSKFWEDEPEGDDGDWYSCGDEHGEIFVCPIEIIKL